MQRIPRMCTPRRLNLLLQLRDRELGVPALVNQNDLRALKWDGGAEGAGSDVLIAEVISGVQRQRIRLAWRTWPAEPRWAPTRSASRP